MCTTFELRLDPMRIDLLLKVQHVGTRLNHCFPKFPTPDTYAKTKHAICMLANMHFTCTLTTEQNQSKSNASGRCSVSGIFLPDQLPAPVLDGAPRRVMVHAIPARTPATNSYLCVHCPRPRIAARDTILVRTLTAVRTPVLLIAPYVTI